MPDSRKYIKISLNIDDPTDCYIYDTLISKPSKSDYIKQLILLDSGLAGGEDIFLERILDTIKTTIDKTIDTKLSDKYITDADVNKSITTVLSSEIGMFLPSKETYDV